MKTSESVKGIGAAIGNFQKAIVAVAKDAQGYGYKYADLPSIWNYIRDQLAANDLAVVQGNRIVEDMAINGVIVETMVIHGKSGEWIQDECFLPSLKRDPQGYGSAITYARRYGLSAMLGIVSDEDDDGAKASTPRQTSNNTAKPAPAPAVNNAAMDETLEKAKAAEAAAEIKSNESYFGTGAAHAKMHKLTELCKGLNESGDSIKWSGKKLDEYVQEQYDQSLAQINVSTVNILIEELQERLTERQAMSGQDDATPSHTGGETKAADELLNARQLDTLQKLCGLKNLKESDVAGQYSDREIDKLEDMSEAEAADAIKGIQKPSNKA